MGFIGPEPPADVRGAGGGLRADREGLPGRQRTAPSRGTARRPWRTGCACPSAIGDFLILRALRESHGAAVAVSETEIIQGVKDAARSEGLFMCPEGGACVAALREAQGRRRT